jgi:hypothetical protein
MRALLVLCMIAWTACAPAGQPEPASPTAPEDTTRNEPAAPTATPTSVPAEPAAAEPATADAPTVETLELTRGKRVETHGVRIMLRGTRTEHRAGSDSVSHAELEVRQGDEERAVALVREPPGDGKFVEVFGVAIALDSIDAARKPSTAKILLRK